MHSSALATTRTLSTVPSRCTWLHSTFRGVTSFESGSLECITGITEIVEASIWFSGVDGTYSLSYGFDSGDEVIINYLIVGHPLEF